MQTVLQPDAGTPLRQAAVRPGFRNRAPRAGAPISWPRVVAGWLERARQRRALARLDARLLADVGITPEEAAREIATPFWR